MCICVSVPFEVWSYASLSLAISLQFKISPFTGSSPAICDVCIISTISSLALIYVHCCCKTEGGSHSCWIRALAFDKRAQAILVIPQLFPLSDMSFHMILYLGLCS